MGGLPCVTKIVLDGGGAAGYAQAIVEAAKTADPALLTDEVAYPIIKQIISAEHALEKAHNMLLDAVGYDGPRP